MSTLALQQTVPVTGIVPSFVAAGAGGDKFPPGDRTILYVKNGGVGSITVTVDSVVPSNYGVDQDGGGAVANGAERMFGPFPAGRWAGTDGLVAVTYSGVTSVTVGVFNV